MNVWQKMVGLNAIRNFVRGLVFSGVILVCVNASAQDNGTLPVRFDSIINNVAAHYSIRPAFIQAVIWRESRFDPCAKGKAGEIGLMQVKMSVVRDWAKAAGVSTPTAEEVFDPYLNIQIGVWNLSRALNNWTGNEFQLELALCEYNAGRSKVLRWVGHHDGNYENVVLYSASAKYVRAISDKFLEITAKQEAERLAFFRP